MELISKKTHLPIMRGLEIACVPHFVNDAKYIGCLNKQCPAELDEVCPVKERCHHVISRNVFKHIECYRFLKVLLWQARQVIIDDEDVRLASRVTINVQVPDSLVVATSNVDFGRNHSLGVANCRVRDKPCFTDARHGQVSLKPYPDA